MRPIFFCGTATLWLLLVARAGPCSDDPFDLSAEEQVLLHEVQHLTSNLAPLLWADWPKQFPPFLFRDRGREVLIGHPDPPGDFLPFESARLGHRLWARVASDTGQLSASYPINGVKTALMSPPGPDDDPFIWVLKAAHEVFHCYQGRRIRDPFIGEFSVHNDLTFPFPYEDAEVAAALRLEGEIVFLLATAESNESDSLLRLLPLVSRVQRTVAGEAAFYDYKVLTEWSEGVARYTERELARLATTSYRPTPGFLHTYPGRGYAKAFQEAYGQNQMINPIRFVGDGVRGRTVFYYLGMGKAYALDRIWPEWRTQYRDKTLDELLERGAASVTHGRTGQ